MVQSKAPHLANEHRYWNQGASVVAGVDEVGKGAWAGPLTIGAVVLPREGSVEGIRDSKMLTPSKRQQLSAQIRSWATVDQTTLGFPELTVLVDRIAE